MKFRSRKIQKDSKPTWEPLVIAVCLAIWKERNECFQRKGNLTSKCSSMLHSCLMTDPSSTMRRRVLVSLGCGIFCHNFVSQYRTCFDVICISWVLVEQIGSSLSFSSKRQITSTNKGTGRLAFKDDVSIPNNSLSWQKLQKIMKEWGVATSSWLVWFYDVLW